MSGPTTLVASGLQVIAEFVPKCLESELVEFLDAIPCVGFDQERRSREFEFTRPMFDGEPLRGREEACAGSPVWLDRVTEGPAIPPVIDELRSRINDHFGSSSIDGAAWSPLTSVYVDRYVEQGEFVAHTDRPVYGPIVVGVSVGPGTGELTFDDGAGVTHAAWLTPRSLYVMSPPLRYEPWVHSFRLERGRRYTISFRSAA